ncbi:glycoside hydrolase family 3 N-terminal domain-containing protein [Oscillatoria sp. FACHB-1406]|uniref:glycoside hydrolase family 3 N-terminal domain-containing protein n=1 Tax=Oscillatoria sp. FACHB-1406 TaxID=2692846 RepID=UPI001F54E7E3|nr:glycoside hydrolase family 3 N-terminal domain-containing protein [Oscillatoria sp. FACHB-1406]
MRRHICEACGSFWVSDALWFKLRRLGGILLQVLQLLYAVVSLGIAANWRSPLCAGIRWEIFWAIAALSLIIIIAQLARFSSPNLKARILKISILVLTAAGLSILLAFTAQLQSEKRAVLSAEASQVERLGEHFIVGYRKVEEVRALVEKRAIAGIFITRRNIEGKTKAEIQQEIQTLQNIRKQQNLSPLWIATDQEGGIVSRLSPPLSKLPQLSAAIAEAKTPAQQEKAAFDYATQQGKELAELGINLNFAPVVDLNHKIINPRDRFSLIYRRAISRDRAVVSRAAKSYCEGLLQQNVYCTLKHFPGLGRVTEDTHLNSAVLETAIAELEAEDWVPFREVLKNSPALTMLGHPILAQLDPNYPVSFSSKVISGVLRDRWQHDGILITDDFSMYAVYHSRYGFKNATIYALNAGVDLILIAYDKDLYYPAMKALLEAQKQGKLSEEKLRQSGARLEGKTRL